VRVKAGKRLQRGKILGQLCVRDVPSEIKENHCGAGITIIVAAKKKKGKTLNLWGGT